MVRDADQVLVNLIMFRACKKEGIHTCLDTNGFVRRYDPVIDELLEVTSRH
jgi:pyruvate-formate lyase-activating enzyme